MKKWFILALVCASLLAVSLVPAQAQQAYNLDFTGGTIDCVSWINGTFGGSLSASQSGSSDAIVSSNNAGGAAPECELFPMTSIFINLTGFTASSFSMKSTGTLNITFFAGACCNGAVYSTNIATAGTFTFNGTDYGSIEIDSFSGVYLDDLIIGTSATGAPEVPRINVGDWGAPIAMYCTEGGGLDIYDIVDDEGFLAYRISDQAIANAIATATESGQNVSLIDIPNAEVWVLSSGEIQVNTGGYAYGFTYQSVCGALPEPALVSSSEIEDEEDVGVIINRSR
jgi:hypothetical protein